MSVTSTDPLMANVPYVGVGLTCSPTCGERTRCTVCGGPVCGAHPDLEDTVNTELVDGRTGPAHHDCHVLLNCIDC